MGAEFLAVAVVRDDHSGAHTPRAEVVGTAVIDLVGGVVFQADEWAATLS
jgi:hypothetical protein